MFAHVATICLLQKCFPLPIAPDAWNAGGGGQCFQHSMRDVEPIEAVRVCVCVRVCVFIYTIYDSTMLDDGLCCFVEK